jgi:glycosyltransferase involved in cell wall biosynthesis
MTAARGKLDILYVGMLPPHPGGSGISWSQLLAGFAARGHTVRALAPITAESLRGGDVFAASHPDIRVSRFLVPHHYTSPNIPAPEEYRRLEHQRISETLLKLIENARPDFIIIGRESFALHVPDLARAHSIPTLLGIRGNTTIAILNGTYPERLAGEMLEQYRKATLLVSAATHMADGLRALGFGNILVVPNAVDLGQFRPRPKDAALLGELGIGGDDIVVVHASNLKLPKRPLDIVMSAEQALQRNPRLCYVIVGDGACRQAMEDACRQKNISSRFRFVGWVEHARVPAWINLADLVVMPSATEGLSRVYIETQACGRVLLASDIPPAREVVEHGKTGLLFRMGDVADLREKTLLAAADPALRARIGEQARKRVQANALDKAVDAYLAIMQGNRASGASDPMAG